MILSEPSWHSLTERHEERARTWTEPHLQRRRRGISHPVMDFLFDYYPYSPGRLATWHPGVGVYLEGNWSPRSSATCYTFTQQGWTVDVRRADLSRLRAALAILEGTASRSAQHSCFGMHEWAMIYQLEPGEIRHEKQPLRVGQDEIADTVHDVGLRCTHIDAFRFFTPAAEPLNAHTPTRKTQPLLEQPGCIHANMDLFKYAMWFQPYLPGDLVLDCFDLAVTAREIDMRASPYDLESLGYAPIAVETSDGRREYAGHQQEIARRAAALRAHLIALLADTHETVRTLVR